MAGFRRKTKGAQRREFTVGSTTYVYNRPTREQVATYRRRVLAQYGGVALNTEPVREFLLLVLHEVRGIREQDSGEVLTLTRKDLDGVELDPRESEQVAGHIADEVDNFLALIEQEKNESPDSLSGDMGSGEPTPS